MKTNAPTRPEGSRRRPQGRNGLRLQRFRTDEPATRTRLDPEIWNILEEIARRKRRMPAGTGTGTPQDPGGDSIAGDPRALTPTPCTPRRDC